MKKEKYKFSKALGFMSDLVSTLHFTLLILTVLFTFGFSLVAFQFIWNVIFYKDCAFGIQGGTFGDTFIATINIVATYIAVVMAYIASSRLYSLFKNLRKGEFFSEMNRKLLYSVANISLVYTVVHLILFVISFIVPIFVEMNFNNGVGFSLGSLFVALFIGGLFKFLAEIVQRGHELQLERDLTI